MKVVSLRAWTVEPPPIMSWGGCNADVDRLDSHDAGISWFRDRTVTEGGKGRGKTETVVERERGRGREGEGEVKIGNGKKKREDWEDRGRNRDYGWEREERGGGMGERDRDRDKDRDRDRRRNSAPLLPLCHFAEIPLKKLRPASSFHHNVSLQLQAFVPPSSKPEEPRNDLEVVPLLEELVWLRRADKNLRLRHYVYASSSVSCSPTSAYAKEEKQEIA
jgi:hypothetical protein